MWEKERVRCKIPRDRSRGAPVPKVGCWAEDRNNRWGRAPSGPGPPGEACGKEAEGKDLQSSGKGAQHSTLSCPPQYPKPPPQGQRAREAACSGPTQPLLPQGKEAPQGVETNWKSQGGLGSFPFSAATYSGGAVVVRERMRQNDEVIEEPVSELHREGQRSARQAMAFHP